MTLPLVLSRLRGVAGQFLPDDRAKESDRHAGVGRQRYLEKPLPAEQIRRKNIGCLFHVYTRQLLASRIRYIDSKLLQIFGLQSSASPN